MAKKPKEIVPFFQLRQQSEDTLQAVAHEIIMTISAIENALQLDKGMSATIKAQLAERAAGLRKVCLSDDGN